MIRYQKLEARKDVKSAPKSSVPNNVFRNATNFHRRDTNKTIHKSDALNKRKKELDELRTRSLAKDIATRLKNAEAPAVANPNNFTERQRKNIRIERAKQEEAKSFLNNYRADGNKLNNYFTQDRRKSLQLERERLKEARIYMNNYRADSSKLDNTFTKHRRKSLELQKSQQQEAKTLMHHYRADGKSELNNFTERRRKSLLLEKHKQEEAKNYLNSYRAELNSLPRSSRRYSTGSKPSCVHGRIDTNEVTPKQLFMPNEKPFTVDHKIECDTSNKWMSFSARKDTKALDKMKLEESRKWFSEVANSSKIGKPPSSEKRTAALAEGDCNLKPSSASQNEKLYNADRATTGQSDRDRMDSNNYFLATLLGLESSALFQEREDELSVTKGSNKTIDCDLKKQIASNDNDLKSITDPYRDGDDDSTRIQFGNGEGSECAQSCERVKGKDCFACIVM